MGAARSAFVALGTAALLVTAAGRDAGVAFAQDPPTAPEAHAGTHNLVRRKIVDHVRAGRLKEALETIATAHRLGGSVGGLDAIPVAQSAVDAAEQVRVAQSKTMFTYYRAQFNTRNEPTLSELKTYLKMKDENMALCDAVRWAERARGRIVEETAARATSLDPAETAEFVSVVRNALRGTRSPEARAELIRAVPLAGRAALLPDLIAIAVNPRAGREERIAALTCAGPALTPETVLELRPALASADPFVRRAAFPVIAGAEFRESVDVLVERVALECGVPQTELLWNLRRLTGQTLGPMGPAWTDWWSAARAEWTKPASVSEPAMDSAAGTKFFGLDIRSSRVLFLLDRSWSMELGMGYDGKTVSTAFDGEPKIEVACRELIQSIRALPDDASFNVIAYGTELKPLGTKLVAATQSARKSAIAWIEKLDLAGATNVSGALMEAFAIAAGGPNAKDIEIPDTIVLLSDGVPNCGPIPDADTLVAEIDRLNPGSRMKIHCVYLGNEGDAKFMQSLATKNGGQFVHHRK